MHDSPMQKNTTLRQSGFTIVELLIVIVVIGILAAIIVVSFMSMRGRASDTLSKNDVSAAIKAIEMHRAATGSYPQTTSDATEDGATGVRTDSNCDVGTKSIDWIPNVSPMYVSQLPQSSGNHPFGDGTGCYKYWSNGENYIISAWGATTASNPEDSDMYRRVGFGDVSSGTSHIYYCNNTEKVGGGSPYDESADLYQHSFTVSNISNCDETHPNDQEPSEPGRTINGVFVPQHVLDWIESNYPNHHIYRVDDDGGEYEIRIENASGDDDYRFEYNGDWELIEIDH